MKPCSLLTQVTNASVALASTHSSPDSDDPRGPSPVDDPAPTAPLAPSGHVRGDDDRLERAHQHFSWLYMPMINAALGIEVDIAQSEAVQLQLGGDRRAATLFWDFVSALRTNFKARGITRRTVMWEVPRVYLSQQEQERLLYPAVFRANGDAAPTKLGRLYQQIAIRLNRR